VIPIPLLGFRLSCALFVASVALSAVAVTLYDHRLWRSRWLLLLGSALCVPIAAGLLLWRHGSLSGAGLGVSLVWSLLPLLALGGVGMLFAAPVNHLLGWIACRRSLAARSARAGARRKFLWDAAALLPAAFAAGAAAMADNDRTRVVNVPFKFRELPPALHGLRILHLSDLHLGAGRTAADLRQLLDGLRGDPPDLIALTGDVADRLEELVAGLQAVTEFAPRFGVYAALGNHEYLNDIERMLPAYLNSSVRLLRGSGEALRIGDGTLFVAGVDDPIYSGPPKPFYERTVRECAALAPPDGFRLLLCHRPDGFEPAAACGFHLTLSGHTHGGQVGLLGRSAFEVLLGVPYLWGSYRRGESRLYTTSGFGHWFPFRLNCPAEAAIITLLRA
jgi:uncharacterized protein